MRRNYWSRFLTLAGGLALVCSLQPFGAKAESKGDLIRAYHENQGQARPAWVTEALERSKAYLRQQGNAHGLRDADTELALRSAIQDDLNQTHVRLDQTHNGVPVFGGQLVAQLDSSGVMSVGGRLYERARIDTRAALNPSQAIKAAVDALGYQGEFAHRPEAKLVVLPNQDGTAGATLTYSVRLEVEDGTDRTGHYQYFIDANTGSVVWSYNDIDYVTATGSGRSLYSGTVSINTDYTNSTYYLRDLTRGSMLTYTMRNGTSSGYYLTDADNVWGNFANSDEDTAGVDAHFGAAKTWDYFYNVHGRRGINGNGYTMNSRVHYGSNYNNAFWNGSLMTYGDGDGVRFIPLVSIDVVGHEITHGLTDFTADLIYSNESGAANESFSDIFGTAIEYYVGSVGGRSPDYLIGEDVYTPGTSGDALRNMENPAAEGDPDHYSKRYTGTGDNGGVHINSGIQNQAFYLLAQGGTNRTSGIAVTGIGRAAAEKIFYRALTVKLFPSATFRDVRAKTLESAAELYGASSTQYNATARAWTAVGVN
ncbi:MAG TPA: M4 family metallopeptidase [Herpetosiphonaceae bacterium]